MNRIRAAVGVALGSAALVLGIGAPAHASTTSHPQLLVIHEQIDFAQNLFTTDGPICRSGSSADDVLDVQPLNAQGTILRVTIDTVYTCDDGSGTFDGHKVLLLHAFPDGSESSVGPIRIFGGTGPYRDILAVGVDKGGANADGLGTGVIRGVIQRL